MGDTFGGNRAQTPPPRREIHNRIREIARNLTRVFSPEVTNDLAELKRHAERTRRRDGAAAEEATDPR
jgi:uncharacterized coiled-coil DUF342 family protein